jgi:hypothetical protein
MGELMNILWSEDAVELWSPLFKYFLGYFNFVVSAQLLLPTTNLSQHFVAPLLLLGRDVNRYFCNNLFSLLYLFHISYC